MAQGFEVDTSSFDAFMKRLSNNERVLADRELRSTAIDIQGAATKLLSENGTNASGQLANSSRVKKQGKFWTVGYYTKYAASVEFGRKAGKAISKEGMISLRQWVRRKLRVPEKEVDNVTFLVARKIARQGTKAQPFLYPSYKKMIKGIERRILKQLLR